MGLHPGGTTSACAENTVTIRVEGFQHGNYLRVRGEYLLPVKQMIPPAELPPRARRIPWCCKMPTRGNRNYLRVRGEYGSR